MSAKDGKRRSDDERQDILAALETWIADGKTLREFCRQDGMPTWRTVYNWLAEDEEFAARIARARKAGADAIAEDCLTIADDARNDWVERFDKEGQGIGWMLNGDHVQRSKLRIETRLKLLAKWNPKKYGDKLDLNHAGKDGGPLEFLVKVDRDPGA